MRSVRKRRGWRVIAAVAVLGLVAAACGNDDSDAGDDGDSGGGGSSENVPGVTDDTITLGFFIAETGPYALANDPDTGIPAALKVAFDEVNAAGGINGRTVELKTYDDGSGDAAVVQQSFREAKDEVFGLMAIIGNTSTALAPLAEQEKLPAIVGNIDGRAARPLEYVFGSIPFWDTSSRLMDDYIVNELDAADKKIGVIYMNSPNGEGAKDAFAEEAEATGLDVVVTQPIEPFPSTCSNEVSKLKDAGAEVVYMITASLPAICVFRSAGDADYSPTWLSPGYGWNLDFVAEGAGGLGEDINPFGHQTTLDTPAGQDYVALVEQFEPDHEPTNDEILAYGMWRLFFEGLEATGPDLTREGFVEAMETEVSGFDSGYLPPPVYNEGEHLGPESVSLWMGAGDRWETLDPEWRSEF